MTTKSKQSGSISRFPLTCLNTYRIEYFFGILLFPAVCSPYILLIYEFISKGFFLDNLPEILTFRTLKLLGSSLLLSVLVSLTSFFLALICLVLLWRIRSGYIRLTILTAAALLFSLSPLIHIIGWQSVPFLAKLPPLFSSVAILSWNAFPVFLMLLLSGLFSMDQAALESAILVCNRKKIIRHFIIPHLFPVSLAAAVITGVMSFNQMEVPGLTGYAVYPEEFLSRIILEDSPGVILWCAVPYGIAAITALLVFTLAWPRHTDMSWRSLSPDLPDKLSEAFTSEKIISLPAISVMALPLFLILKTSGMSGFSDFWSANAQSVQTSLSYGLLSVVIAMITACLLTDWLLELSPAWRNIFMGIFMLQLLIPGTLTGLGMKSLTRFSIMLWLDTGNRLMIISHSLRMIPYAVFLLYALRRINESLVQDSIRLMNISWFGKKRFLHFPADRAGLTVISGILFVLVLSELSATILVVSPGTETIILRLYNMLHYGAYETVAKLALVQSVLVTAVMAVLWGFISMGRRRSGRD